MSRGQWSVAGGQYVIGTGHVSLVAQTHMKYSYAIIGMAAVFLITLPACTKKLVERPLTGRYHLVNPAGCRDDIQDSTLLVRDDGT